MDKDLRQKRISGGSYQGDYSPRYQEAFDIFEKAKDHMKKQKRRDKIRKQEKSKE